MEKLGLREMTPEEKISHHGGIGWLFWAINIHATWIADVNDCAYELAELGGNPATAYEYCAHSMV